MWEVSAPPMNQTDQYELLALSGYKINITFLTESNCFKIFLMYTNLY